jgi:hypothetical protein
MQKQFNKYQESMNKKLKKTETTKWTQRGFQQTPKWNKGEYYKRGIGNKEDKTISERGV